jgi:hypothetical protein
MSDFVVPTHRLQDDTEEPERYRGLIGETFRHYPFWANLLIRRVPLCILGLVLLGVIGPWFGVAVLLWQVYLLWRRLPVEERSDFYIAMIIAACFTLLIANWR